MSTAPYTMILTFLDATLVYVYTVLSIHLNGRPHTDAF